jgi:hypothetical protein
MKSFDLNAMSVQEMNAQEISRTNGGGFLTLLAGLAVVAGCIGLFELGKYLGDKLYDYLHK